MDIDLRVSDAAKWRGVAGRGSVFVPLAGLAVLAGTGRLRVDPLAGVVIAVLGVLVAAYAIGLTVVGLQVAEGVVAVRRLARRPRTFPPGTLARSVFVRGYEQMGTTPAPRLVLLGADGRRLLTVSGHTVDGLDLARFARALPGERIRIDETVTPAELARRAPGAVPWWERHPWGLAWLVVGVVVVLATLYGLLQEGTL